MSDEYVIRGATWRGVTGYLDRPKANAIDVATSRALGRVFSDFRDDPDLRVAIITGAGKNSSAPGWDKSSSGRRSG